MIDCGYYFIIFVLKGEFLKGKLNLDDICQQDFSLFIFIGICIVKLKDEFV